MSLREVLHLTQETAHDDKHYNAKLFTAMVNIILQLSDICEENDISLDHIHSFEYTKNEWAIALTQIYEKLYRKDGKDHVVDDKEGRPVL